MQYTVIFGVREQYNADTFAHTHAVTVLMQPEMFGAKKEELIEHAYDQYIARVADGYLPLIPDQYNDSDWTIQSHVLSSATQNQIDLGIDAGITLKYALNIHADCMAC